MAQLKSYDWSTLDRQTLISVVNAIKNDVVDCPLTPKEFTRKIREQFRLAQIPIKVKTLLHKETDDSWIWVAGEYWSCKDKKNKKFLTLTLHYNPTNTIIRYSYDKFRRLCRSVADTVLHEVIHTRQYRRRNHKQISGYYSVAESSKQRIEQEYLGHSDEVDAYAFNIACYLQDEFKGDTKLMIKYINSDLSDKRLKKNSYKMYQETFNFNHNHRIIKVLKKKIIYYLPYAELGKPYKTSDWLKK
jgi:hypothetical protein